MEAELVDINHWTILCHYICDYTMFCRNNKQNTSILVSNFSNLGRNNFTILFDSEVISLLSICFICHVVMEYKPSQDTSQAL